MERKRAKMALIDDETSRRATYNKRKKGMLKKLSELTTLCGISATAIVYGENNTVPEVWPSQPEALRVLNRFQNLTVKDQTKSMIDNESLILKKKITEAKEQLKKLEKEIRAKELELLVAGVFKERISLNDLSVDELNALGLILEEKINMITEIQVSNEAGCSSSQPPQETPNGNQQQENVEVHQLAEALLALNQDMNIENHDEE